MTFTYIGLGFALIFSLFKGCSAIQTYFRDKEKEKEQKRMEELRRSHSQESGYVEPLELRWERMSREAEMQSRMDSLAAIKEEEKKNDVDIAYNVETMVRAVATENYTARVFRSDKVDDLWIMFYSRGRHKVRYYARTFNPRKKTYGKEMRLVEERVNRYHLASNRNKVYEIDATLIYYENGVEKEVWWKPGMLSEIDLYNSNDNDDGYESAEDCYYDNAEDLLHEYGGQY